jgi:hypothetical protein
MRFIEASSTVPQIDGSFDGSHRKTLFDPVQDRGFQSGEALVNIFQDLLHPE